MLNWIGLATEFVFVFALIGIAQLLRRRGLVGGTLSRKIIHIGVSHWWLMAMYFHDNVSFAAVGPVVFIGLNYYSHRTRLFDAMEEEASRGNLGTVYFPVSLLLLVMLSFAGPVPRYVAGIGVLTMGWGDGLASLLGRSTRGPVIDVFGGRKSLVGTLSMFLASAAVAGLFTYYGHPLRAGAVALAIAPALLTAAAATIVELLTPLGLDNLSVPIVTTLFYQGVFA
jgi:phytol kinase